MKALNQKSLEGTVGGKYRSAGQAFKEESILFYPLYRTGFKAAKKSYSCAVCASKKLSSFVQEQVNTA